MTVFFSGFGRHMKATITNAQTSKSLPLLTKLPDVPESAKTRVSAKTESASAKKDSGAITASTPKRRRNIA
jgi:hypothetical protein